MTITFRNGELRELLREHGLSLQPEMLANDQDETLTYPDWLGRGQLRDIELPSGIYLTFHQYQLSRDIIYKCSPCEHDCLEFVFSLDSHYCYNKDKHFGSSQAHIDPPFCQVVEVRQYARQNYQAVDIHLDPPLLSSLMGHAGDRLPTQLAQVMGRHRATAPGSPVELTALMQAAVAQMLRCPYQGITRTLYLEAKSLELISHFIAAGEESPSVPGVLSRDDRECIHQARQLLLDNLHSPPSLVGLARQVGLNDRKLKEGFREIFGTTVFGYLTQQRLEQASVLLAEQVSIAAVSAAVGYASPTAFSGAFRRRFGVSPKAYQIGQRCVA